MGLLGMFNLYGDQGQPAQQGSSVPITKNVQGMQLFQERQNTPTERAEELSSNPLMTMLNKRRDARLAQAAKYQARHDQMMTERNAPITGDLALYRSGQTGERSTSTDPMSTAKPASAAGMQLGRHKSIGLGRTKF